MTRNSARINDTDNDMLRFVYRRSGGSDVFSLSSDNKLYNSDNAGGTNWRRYYWTFTTTTTTTYSVGITA